MHFPDTAKPATALHGEPASNFEQLGGQLCHLDTRDRAFVQASRLRRLYALTYETAATVATLAYGGGAMTRTSPNWLTCQITGITDYICNTPAGLDVLDTLAFNFRKAAERVEAEFKRREAAGRDYYDDGMFG